MRTHHHYPITLHCNASGKMQKFKNVNVSKNIARARKCPYLVKFEQVKHCISPETQDWPKKKKLKAMRSPTTGLWGLF